MTGSFPSLKQIGGHNTAKDLEIGIPAALAAGFLGPELLPGLGFGEAAAAGAPLDILAGGEAANTAIPAALGEFVAPSGALASGLAAEPGFAESALGAFAPGLDTTAAGVGAGLPLTAAPTVGAAPSGIVGASPAAPGAGGDFPTIGPGAPANTTLVASDPTVLTPSSSGPASGFSISGESVSPSDITGLDTTSTTASTASNLLGGIGNFFKNNAGLLSLLGLGVGGQLASPAISKALGLNKVPGAENLTNLAQQEQALAAQQAGYGQTLEQPLVTGVLPPGQQQAVTNALNDAIATIKGRYGALGLSGSSMEAEAIANAQNRSVEVAGQLEQQMAQTGQQAVSSATRALGLESQIYDTILQATIQQDQQLGNAISQFASSVGMGQAIGQAKKTLAA